MELILQAIINTCIIVMIIPVFGLVLNFVNNKLLQVLAEMFGRAITMFIGNYLTFIGTVHHELSHALFAFCTGAKVIKIDLFHPDGYSLGKVIFCPRGNKIMQSIQLTMASIAPVVTGCISEYLLLKYLSANDVTGWLLWIIYYLIISILLHMTLSKSDIKNGLKGLPICMVIIFIVCIVFNINIVGLILNV